MVLIAITNEEQKQNAILTLQEAINKIRKIDDTWVHYAQQIKIPSFESHYEELENILTFNDKIINITERCKSAIISFIIHL